jgi:hypothetical protein
MIRRDAGHDFLLITQTDHAQVAQQLAQHIGNSKFTPLSPQAITAIGLHDAGWPLHDDQPTLNSRRYPLDVFEIPRPIALTVWAASAQRAASADPYAGLLVSLHSLALSIHAASPPPNRTEQFDVKKMHEQFELNKFQHREVERQEQLRRQLNFDPTLLLKHGLADPRASKKDDQLRFDFRLLQAMDLISLCLCCTHPPQPQTGEVLKNPAASPTRLHLSKSLDGVLHVDPWPFNQRRLQLTVPTRRLPAKTFDSPEEFQAACHSAPQDPLPLTLSL